MKEKIIRFSIIAILGTIFAIFYIQYQYDPFSETVRLTFTGNSQHTIFYEEAGEAIFENSTKFDEIILWDPKIIGERIFPVKGKILPEPPDSFKFGKSFFFIDSLKKVYIPLFKVKSGTSFFSKENGKLKQEESLESDIIIANPETSSDGSLIIINKDWISGEKKDLTDGNFFLRKNLILLNPSPSH